jgi:hypothetical protein
LKGDILCILYIKYQENAIFSHLLEKFFQKNEKNASYRSSVVAVHELPHCLQGFGAAGDNLSQPV